VTATTVREGTVVASGLELAFADQGEGDPLLLLHGSAVGRELWRETLAELDEAWRAVALDRRAYGASEAPDPYRGTTVSEQGEDAAAAIEALGLAPALLCGHELGALIALDLMWRHPRLVRGAVLVEPPVLALSIEGPAVMSALREAIEKGAREAEDPRAGAVDAYLRETAGEAAFDLLGTERVRAARASARALAADLVAAPTYAFGRRELRTLAAPVALVAGARSGHVRREVARALCELLPQAALHTPDSGHLVPVEAPAAVAAAIAEVGGR
jgi:pimeloyl-ACP methyl ester carboxylesterase